MTITQPRKAKELVINWHMTEACNYSCKYCFAKWGRPNELCSSELEITNLLDKLADYFIKGTPVLKEKLGYESVRLNFAGGEPMMLKNKFVTALVLAKQKGFKTSIITNGHYLIHGKSLLPKDTLDMIGISFDSQYLSTRMKIGRNDRKENSFSVNDLTHTLANLAHLQTGIKIKINTVVNRHNWQEDFSNLISTLNPYKWKVLQVMPYGDDDLLISKSQFDDFIQRHSGLGLPIYSESNSTMTESYLMINPEGCFYQNIANKSGYKYSECINITGVEKALSQIEFNPTTFASRYKEKNIDIVEVP